MLGEAALTARDAERYFEAYRAPSWRWARAVETADVDRAPQHFGEAVRAASAV